MRNIILFKNFVHVECLWTLAGVAGFSMYTYAYMGKKLEKFQDTFVNLLLTMSNKLIYKVLTVIYNLIKYYIIYQLFKLF